MSDLKKGLLIAAGSLCVGLAILGIILPLLPTTPFLLLGAACYIRSSSRFYRRLLSNRYLGDYIRNYREGRGIPAHTKAVAIITLWITIAFSMLVVVDLLPVKVLLFAIAVGVSIHILTRPTYRPSTQHTPRQADSSSPPA